MPEYIIRSIDSSAHTIAETKFMNLELTASISLSRFDEWIEFVDVTMISQ